jgi:hypothetical protein
VTCGPAERLANFSAQHGMSFIDTLPAMKAAMAKSSTPLYWPNDGHCTSDGYYVIAKAIYRGLIQRGLIQKGLVP